MKQKLVLIFSLLIISMSITSQNMRNTYESNWKLVEKFTEESLPQSAIKEIDKLLKLAIKDKNTPQVIKALDKKMTLEYEIDPDRDYSIYPDLEKMLLTANVTEKALLHSILAQIYLNEYMNDRWIINQRTMLSGEVPSDMKEWTSNIYADKVFFHTEASIQDKEVLKKEQTQSYSDIISIGKDSKKYYPTLYDFIMEKSIICAKQLRDIGREEFDLKSTGLTADQLILPAKEYISLKINSTAKYVVLNLYQQYLADLQERGLTGTMILTELDKIQYAKFLSGSINNEKLLAALINLESVYSKNETTVEIIDAITHELRNSYGYRPRRFPIQPSDNMHEEANKKIYTWLKKGIEEYPNYDRINILKNKLAYLESPILSIYGEKLFYSNQPILFTVNHKNNQTVKSEKSVKLLKVENDKEVFMKSYPLHFSSTTSYDLDTAKLEIGKLPFGKYLFSEDNDLDTNTKFEFSVSDLLSFSRNSAKNEYEIFVVDRKSGKPLKGATITLYETEYSARKENKLITTLTTNEHGLAIFKNKKEEKDQYKHDVAVYSVSLGNDNALQDQTLYSGSYNYNSNYVNEPQSKYTTSIFADRSIYRPSQTIHYKAIITDSNSKVVSNLKQVVKLYNPNGEIVSEKNLVTNEYGSIAGEFILPQGGLLGLYYISVDNNNNLYFNVEEYKQPTFEVKFDKIDKTYTFGEKITLKGNAKTFSGINLQDADVNYRITRRPFSFWYWNIINESHYTDGIAKTKEDGTFEIVFTPETGDGNNMFGREIYTFNITADITDLNGETQTNSYTISVGEQSMILDVQIPAKVEKSANLIVKIGAKNLDGSDIKSSGSYTIHTLDKNDSIQSQVLTGTFNTGVQDDIARKIKNLNSGKHRIIVKGKDDNGKDIESKTDFVLYSFADKRPPIQTNDWLVEKENNFKNGKSAEIIYGVTDPEVYVLYQLYNNKTVFERKFIKLSNANQTFKVPYNAEYGDEIYMSFTYAKDGNLATHNVLLKKEDEKKDVELKVKLDVFRDKLRPGQEETWTLSVKDINDKGVSAEVLASMYDTSLDNIMPLTSWIINRPYIPKDYINQLYYNVNTPYATNYMIDLKAKLATLNVESLSFDKYTLALRSMWVLNEPVLRSMGASSVARPAPTLAKQKNEMTSDQLLSESVTQEGISFVPPQTEMSEDELALGGGSERISPAQAPQIRKNFNETAFFYPQLKTNELGETQISFTVPESNTTWRFRALTHDKESKVGELEKMVVTRKELMITPNMPRFVRQGDKTNIATKISNLSENSINGETRIEFFNPIDESVINLVTREGEQAFSLDKDASGAASWTFNIPMDIDLLGVRIIAESESFSDGEQHVLAVLPNRMLVTESMPVDVTEKGNQTFTLEKLANNKSNSIDNYKLTFEFASNPAWYAVQALPTMSNPTTENAVSWFASYYVNTLGASLMKQYPKVANMIQAWKKQGATKETLVSKLQKDQELKTVLLEETPWVLDAKNEIEQMERLSLLFDLNNTKQQTSTALAKLQDLQVSDGAWTWYKGMYPSRSISQYMLYGFAKLQTEGQVEHTSEVKAMQMNALKYVDGQIVEDYNRLRKHNKEWEKITSISDNQMEYLYIRAMYRDIPVSQETREAERFYTDVVSKNWTKISLYQKALLAVLLPQLGDKTLATKITASIREHAVTKKEMGMYWPKNKANVFLSMSPISYHTFMMEAMKANGASSEDMDMMKRWLVKQKQTNVWESTHASIDAINALLSTGSDWFSDGSTTIVKVGDNTINPDNKELGTGYYKTSWSKSEIKNDMAKVTLNSVDSKPAYGALYWQYYENLDKITKQDGALNISKELYKEMVGESGKSLTKISETNSLTIGDKVVIRLVVKTDRNLEFVQLKDMRASCFEPAQAISGMAWQNGAPYYQETKDASTNFYFDALPKGTYVFEYSVHVNRIGEYSNGITSIQCAYAPEFTSHTAGIKVMVK